MTRSELLELPRDFGGRVYVAFPNLPVPRASDAGRAFYQLVGSLKLPPRREAFQVWAYSAGRIIIEALRSAGRRLDRETLIAALEGCTVSMPAPRGRIRFGPGRRIGASGAAIVEVDVKARRLLPVRDWVRAD